MGNLVCTQYRFTIEALEPLRLNAFAGSTLRGGFGHVFKRVVCTWPPADCPRCLLKNTCSYPYIFETAPPPGSAELRGLDQVPRPYVIEPPEEKVCEEMGTGSGPAIQNPHDIDNGPVPVPISSQTQSGRLYQPGDRFDFRPGPDRPGD